MLVLAGPAMAATIVVDAGGKGDYTTIGEALCARLDGDVIEVRAGDYFEGDLYSTAGCGQGGDLTLEGEDPYTTRVIGDDTYYYGLVARGDVVVRGLGFSGFTSGEDAALVHGGCVDVEPCSFLVEDALFEGNDMLADVLVTTGDIVDGVVRNSVFQNSSRGVVDIYIDGSMTVENNVFVDVDYPYVACLYAYQEDIPHDFVHNTVVGAMVGVFRSRGYPDSGECEMTIANNVFSHTETVYGVFTHGQDAIFAHNLLYDYTELSYVGGTGKYAGYEIEDSYGNLEGEPEFVHYSDEEKDLSLLDLRLLGSSDAIDLGSVSFGAEVTDADGTERPLDGDLDGEALPDAGAYELDPDLDDDGYADEALGGTDCDDGDASIGPGAEEVCEDGVDQDCDGLDGTCLDTADTGDTNAGADSGTGHTGGIDSEDLGDSAADTGPGASDTGGAGKTGCGEGCAATPAGAWWLAWLVVWVRLRQGRKRVEAERTA